MRIEQHIDNTVIVIINMIWVLHTLLYKMQWQVLANHFEALIALA